MAFKRNPKMLDQLQYCEKNQVELCVIVGDSELKAGIVKIRDVATRDEVKYSFVFEYKRIKSIDFFQFSLKFHVMN